MRIEMAAPWRRQWAICTSQELDIDVLMNGNSITKYPKVDWVARFFYWRRELDQSGLPETHSNEVRNDFVFRY